MTSPLKTLSILSAIQQNGDDPLQDLVKYHSLPLHKKVLRILWFGLKTEPVARSSPTVSTRSLVYLPSSAKIAVLKCGSYAVYSITDSAQIIQTDFPPTISIVYSIAFHRCNPGLIGLGTSRGFTLLKKPSCQNTWTEKRLDKDPIDCIDFHPKQFQAAVAGPKSAGFYIYDLNSGSSRHIWNCYERVTDLKFSPCGCFIMTICDHRWVMIWDTAEFGVTLLTGNLCTGFVKAASWSLTDGKESHLIVAFSETCLRMYCMDSIWNTATELSLTHTDDILAWKYKNRRVRCVKCMEWEEGGRRLAVLLENPHAKAGKIAIFNTDNCGVLFDKYISLNSDLMPDLQ